MACEKCHMAETFRLDHNHSGVRFALLVAVGLGVAVGLLAVPPLLRALGLSPGVPMLVGVLSAVALAAGFSWLVERALRRIWPSGRTITVDDGQVHLRERSGDDAVVRWNGDVEVLSWCFVVNTRRAWVPRGWYCVALRIKQGDQLIIPYALAKPSLASELPLWEAFEELIPRKRASDFGEEVFASQEHLRDAEEQRWWVGGEMLFDDFAALVRAVYAHAPGWPRGRT